MSQTSKAVFVALIFISTNLVAQEGWMPGIGPAIANNTSSIGINTRAYYGIDERFCFGPELSIFPYKEINDAYEASLWEVNLNAHYVFELAHRFGTYPLAGFGYTVEKERSLTNMEEIERHSAPGINYGIGLHYAVNRVLLFGEFKGVIGDLNDEFFTVGIVILLKKPNNQNQH